MTKVPHAYIGKIQISILFGFLFLFFSILLFDIIHSIITISFVYHCYFISFLTQCPSVFFLYSFIDWAHGVLSSATNDIVDHFRLLGAVEALAAVFKVCSPFSLNSRQ